MNPSSSSSPPNRLTLKTYSHLASQKRIPTDYEIATSKLLYYPKKGFEVKTPITNWYTKFQTGSLLQSKNWEKFKDPREMTYTKYTTQQKNKEIFVEGLFETMNATDYDQRLNAIWIQRLAEYLSLWRFLFHGFQMTAAYIGSMAPEGRVTITAAFQAADELRKVQTFSYRLQQLQRLEKTGLNLIEQGRVLWTKDPLVQPLREITEKILVTYDWGEAFVALNVCLKPLVDDLILLSFPRIAKEYDDDRLEEIFFSLYEDSLWQRSWTNEFLKTVRAEQATNRNVICSWIEKWQPLSVAAGTALAERFKVLSPQADVLLRDCLKAQSQLFKGDWYD